MNKFRLTVSSPDGNLFDEDIFSFTVRGTEGELAILAGHVPFVTSVVSAPCSIWKDEETLLKASSAGGILCVDTKGATFISSNFRFSDEA